MDQPLWGDEAWAYSDLIGGKSGQKQDAKGQEDRRKFHDGRIVPFSG